MARPIKALDVTARTSSAYPAEFADAADGRAKRALGDVFDLDQFGVNLTTLAPDAQSALRHWHSAEDEFLYVLEGTVTLVTGDGATEMSAGDCVGFKAGVKDGHHLVNRSGQPASVLEVGSRRIATDEVGYPDDDLKVVPDGSGKRVFKRRDGTEI